MADIERSYAVPVTAEEVAALEPTGHRLLDLLIAEYPNPYPLCLCCIRIIGTEIVTEYACSYHVAVMEMEDMRVTPAGEREDH